MQTFIDFNRLRTGHEMSPTSLKSTFLLEASRFVLEHISKLVLSQNHLVGPYFKHI